MMQDYLRDLDQELQNWLDFYGKNEAAWQALGSALREGKDSTGCIAAFLLHRPMPTALDIERVLHVILKYTKRKNDISHIGAYSLGGLLPIWTLAEAVYPDGYEVQQLWGDLRSVLNSTDSKEEKKRAVRGIFTILRFYMNKSPARYIFHFRDLYTQMWQYAQKVLGDDL